MVLNYLTNLTALFVLTCSFAIIVVISSGVKWGVSASVAWLVTHFSPNEINVVFTSFLLNRSEYVAALLLILSYFHMMAMVLSRPRRPRRKLLEMWSLFDRQRRIMFLSWLAVSLLFLWFFRDYLKSPFGVFAILFFCFSTVSSFIAVSTVALRTLHRRTWIAFPVLAALTGIVYVYRTCVVEMNSVSLRERARAFMALGAFSTNIGREQLAAILESDLNEWEISVLGRRYQNDFLNGGSVRKGSLENLQFKRVLANKKELPEILSAASLFEVSDLGLEELNLLFTKMADVRSWPDKVAFLKLLPAKIRTEEVTLLLDSKNDRAIYYGLLRARYERSGGLVPEITKRIPSYKDRLRWEALQTVSLLCGRYVGLDDFENIRKDRTLASPFLEVSCERVRINDIHRISAEDMSLLNVCLRERVDKKDLVLLEEIESIGWIDPPLNSYQQKLLKRIFR